MLTNKLSLPEPFHAAAESHLYSKGRARYSVTELIDPPRVGALHRLYKDAIVEDVADNVDALMGTMFHKMLEAAGAARSGAVLEERLYAEVDGIVISGAMDHTLLNEVGELDDYKATKVYSVRSHLRHGKHDWIAQLNMYRWLRALQGQSISKLRIIAWIKDWAITEFISSEQRGGDYPKHAILPLDVEVWPLEQTEAYVRERIRLHLEADVWATNSNREEPLPAIAPLCTDNERWRNPQRFACMKEGRKTAVKLYDTEAEAKYAAGQTKGGYVEPRGGEYKRCLFYCSPGRAGLCSQWNEDKAKQPEPSYIDTSVFD